MIVRKVLNKLPESFVIDETLPSGFNRYDVIVRLLSIENYQNDKTYDFKLYKKMQDLRVAEKNFETVDYVSRFKHLIDSFEERGFDKNSPIILNSQSRLINGAHRLAISLYYNISHLPCVYSRNINELNTICEYGIEWFIKNNFNFEEISIIENRYKTFIKQKAEIVYAIIWPLGYNLFDQIISVLLRYGELISYKVVNFENKNELEKYINLVYSTDQMKSERLVFKKDIIIGTKTRINYKSYMLQLRIKLSLSEAVLYHQNINYQANFLIGLKTDVRSLLKKKLNDYCFDNAFHSGNSMRENAFLQKIYERERQVCKEYK